MVELEGRLDARSTPEVKAKLQELIAGGDVRLVINLARVTFIDSSGLGMLVGALRRAAAEGGDLKLAEVPEFTRTIFELTRLTRVFEITHSEQQALEGFAKSEDQAAKGDA